MGADAVGLAADRAGLRGLVDRADAFGLAAMRTDVGAGLLARRADALGLAALRARLGGGLEQRRQVTPGGTVTAGVGRPERGQQVVGIDAGGLGDRRPDPGINAGNDAAGVGQRERRHLVKDRGIGLPLGQLAAVVVGAGDDADHAGGQLLLTGHLLDGVVGAQAMVVDQVDGLFDALKQALLVAGLERLRHY